MVSWQHAEADQESAVDARPPTRRALAGRWLLRFVERAFGECFALSLPLAVLALVAVAVLLAVIAYTLSVANAVLVVAAAVAMRITCERRNRRLRH